MNIASAFNLPVLTAAPTGGGAAPPSPPGPGAPPAPAAPAGVSQQGAFVTPQTIASFAGATFVVQLLWNVAGMIVPGWERKPLVALVASMMVGIILYLISETGDARGPVSRRERLIGIFIAMINTLVIFSAAVGAGGVLSTGTPAPVRIAGMAFTGAG